MIDKATDKSIDTTTDLITEQTKADIVISPCCGVCALDDDDICIGCLRSGVEITRWGKEDSDGKRAILGNVEERFRRQYQK